MGAMTQIEVKREAAYADQFLLQSFARKSIMSLSRWSPVQRCILASLMLEAVARLRSSSGVPPLPPQMLPDERCGLHSPGRAVHRNNE
jgi:hypothetical protein